MEAARSVAVEGSPAEIGRVFVYPNPTRDPQSAGVSYQLSLGGPIRLSVVDISGRVLGTRDISYDPVHPDAGVDVGLSTVPLRDILDGSTLAPGLYLVRVELFQNQTESADVVLAKFAVLR